MAEIGSPAAEIRGLTCDSYDGTPTTQDRFLRANTPITDCRHASFRLVDFEREHGRGPVAFAVADSDAGAVSRHPGDEHTDYAESVVILSG